MIHLVQLVRLQTRHSHWRVQAWHHRTQQIHIPGRIEHLLRIMVQSFSLPSHLSFTFFLLLLPFTHFTFPFLPVLHFLLTLLLLALLLFALLPLAFPLLAQLSFFLALQFTFAFLLTGQSSSVLLFQLQAFVQARYRSHAQCGRCGTGQHAVHVRRHIVIHL